MAFRQVIQKPLQVGHARLDKLRRRRHQLSRRRRGPTDPVLDTAKLARRLARSTPRLHELFVQFSNQARRQGQALVQAFHPVVERCDIAGHFGHVVNRHARSAVCFEQHQVGQRGSRAFDLRRKHRFFAHVAVKKGLRVRQERGQAVKSAEREVGLIELALKSCADFQRWPRRQGLGNKAFAGHAGSDAGFVAAGWRSIHGLNWISGSR